MPTLTDRYELHDVVYSDRHVVAYRAHDRLLNRPVTVELLQAQYAADPVFVQRLIDKARQAALASLPYVAALYDQHMVDGRPFLVLEEAAGPALREAHPLPADQAVALISMLAQTAQAALARSHPLPTINEHTVRIGAEGHFQVLDFGLEQLASDPAQAGAILGHLLRSALSGTPDAQRATPLQHIAERAIAGHYASPQALIDELHAVERRSSQATTVLPRVPPTIDMRDAADRQAVDTAAPVIPANAAPASRRSLPTKAVLGVLALALVLLLGGALLSNRSAGRAAPSGSSTPDTGGAPATSTAAQTSAAPLPVGEAYVVAARGSQTVRVRSGPGTSAPHIASLRNGTVVQVISEPQSADGYRWVRIVADGVDGWCILEALRKQ